MHVYGQLWVESKLGSGVALGSLIIFYEILILIHYSNDVVLIFLIIWCKNTVMVKNLHDAICMTQLDL
jgi:hypothetical protein